MPELPEVETVARGLRAVLVGRRILAVRLGKTDFMDDPAALERNLPGNQIVAVERFGKFLLLRLASGNGPAPREPRQSLLVHLGMTGQLVSQRADEPPRLHTHAAFLLDDGRELRYTDIRRFGRLAVVAESALAQHLGLLGADPLEVGEEEFCAKLGARRAMVKALLLDQHVLRGMGNIYADESLWRARIHPQRRAAQLRRAQLAQLRRAVREVLEAAIRLRGSSISDFVDAVGEPGDYQRRHRVYQREGKPCFRCGGKIRRVIVAGRSSYFCPRCQPATRERKRNFAVQLDSSSRSEEGRMKTDMSLPDQIAELYRHGKLPREFRVADVRKHIKRFSPKYINTALANYAKDTGNYVQRWSKARFRRVARGLYEIIV